MKHIKSYNQINESMNDADMIDDLFGIKLDTFESILSTLYSIENCEIYYISVHFYVKMKKLTKEYNDTYNKPGFREYWKLYEIDNDANISKVDIDDWEKFKSDYNLDYKNFLPEIFILFNSFDEKFEQIHPLLSQKFSNIEFSKVHKILYTKYEFGIQILNVKD